MARKTSINLKDFADLTLNSGAAKLFVESQSRKEQSIVGKINDPQSYGVHMSRLLESCRRIKGGCELNKNILTRVIEDYRKVKSTLDLGISRNYYITL